MIKLNYKLANLMVCEQLFFLVSNRIPRRLVTRFMGRFSKIEQPIIRDLSLAVWQRFAELDLSDAAKPEFSSLHDCFIRQLKPGARPVDGAADVLVSPCDAIVGACGEIDGVQLIQAKGFPYTLHDLLADPELVELYQDGSYVTLRLTASMYHRFHAPHDLQVEQVTYISGDTWNTHPVALARVEKLYCKNERAVLRTRLDSGALITLVPVAAILVASIKLHFLDVLLHLRHKGPNRIACAAQFSKGDEMGYFQHGSTIIVFAPRGFALHESVQPGHKIRMGMPLLTMPTDS